MLAKFIRCCSNELLQLAEVGLALLQQWRIQLQSSTGGTSSLGHASTTTSTSSTITFTTSSSTSSQVLDTGGACHVTVNLLQQLYRALLYRLVLEHHRNKAVPLMMAALRRLPSKKERRKFLERRGYWEELLEMERKEGNFLRVAQVGAAEGKGLGSCCRLLKYPGLPLQTHFTPTSMS